MTLLEKLCGGSRRNDWQGVPPFSRLTKTERQQLARRFERRRVAQGAQVVIEGQPADDLIFVEAGTLELSKHDPKTHTEHVVGRVGSGQIVGGPALLDGKPWATSARAEQACTLMVLPFRALREQALHVAQSWQARVYQELVVGLGTSLATRVREQVDLSLQAARQRAVMGQFIVNLLILVCCYVLFLNALPLFWDRISPTTETFSLPLIAIFGIFSWRFIRNSGYPLSHFGIGTRHLLGSFVEAVLFTLPFLGLVTLLKALVVWLSGSEQPIIEHLDVGRRFQESNVALWLRIYAATAVVQELIVRGALQSSLEAFLTGPGRRTRAIVVCALLFSISHLHISYLFSLLAIVPGLFWGWLYSRRPNLLGVSLSHIVVGAFVFFVLGIAV